MKSPISFTRTVRSITQGDQFRLIRYFVAGVSVSLGYTLTIIALVDWGPALNPELANVVSFLLWTVASYLAHRGFTFRFEGAYGDSAFRFIVVSAVKLLASMAVMVLITRYYESSYLVGILLNWVVLPLISYVVMKVWVFQQTFSAKLVGSRRG